jgi:hypothetical protein
MFKFKSKKTIHQRQGLLAKRNGQDFEDLIEISCRLCGWGWVKIPSGCKWVSGTRAIPVKTPFDFVLFNQSHSVYLDAKTVVDNAFSYSKIDDNQLKWLSHVERFEHVAGYLVNFSELNKTVFFSAKQLSSLRPRQSLKPDNGLLLGDNQRINLGGFGVLLQKAKENKGTAIATI